MINLREVSRQELQALKRLREPGNDALVKLLQDQFEGAKSKLVHAGETVSIHRLQGRAEAFEDLLKAVEESADALKGA